MTFLTAQTEVLKQDARGRVRVPRERREALLEEFEKSGASGVKFARLAGIKYPTFANWVQARRKARAERNRTEGATAPRELAGGGGAVRMFEAVVDGRERLERAAADTLGLCLELPGGSRLLINSPCQLPLAAELVTLIAQAARARC